MGWTGPIRRAAIAGSVCALAFLTGDARACKPALPRAHMVDAARRATDRQAPQFTTTPVVMVTRGADPELTACDRNPTGDTCLDSGQIVIVVSAGDDQTPTVDCGFRLTLAGGRLPEGLFFPTQDVRAPDGEIRLPWADASTNGAEPIAFVVAIAPIDSAGNAGTPVELSVSHGGEGGCSVGGGGRPGTWLALLLVALWGGLRRQGLHCRDARGP